MTALVRKQEFLWAKEKEVIFLEVWTVNKMAVQPDGRIYITDHSVGWIGMLSLLVPVSYAILVSVSMGHNFPDTD